jgi:NADPH:quinone reductase-like Zn-dependent oxidoreductase
MKAWEIADDGGIDALNLAERPSPEPGPGQVKVRVRANSINYRDLNTVRAPGRMGVKFPRVPNSDGAGDVVAVGPGVSAVAVGDRVAGCFFQDWAAGGISARVMASAQGGPIDGMLAEEVVLNEDGVVPIPEPLDYEQAATLPCAALTAWHALVVKGGLKAGDTVLLLGTGGVSIFALQFCTMMGARTIITSKSDDKLARARAMGAWQTINYAETPDWAAAVRELTGGVGVDHIVEVGGAGTLEQSIDAVRIGGHIALIGVLTAGTVNPTPILRKSIRLNGIYVGSQAMFRDMNAAIAANRLEPVIDRSVDFAAAPDAYHHMEAAGHFGKITITLPD